ncbi:multidrug-efflux transport protein precursor [Bacteroidales bacterium]|nr:multidrug-efflux transport protein precursor [Bacteroidales bacterium]
MNYRMIKKISLGALSMLLLVSCGKEQSGGRGQAPPQEYKTKVLNKENAGLEKVYPATIKGQEDIEIRPRIDGFIEQIFVDEGSIVRKGQALFRINSPQMKQALLTAKANVASAEASLNTAQLNVAKTIPLAEKEIVSQYQLEMVKNSLSSAQAMKDQANAALQNAVESEKWTTVTSPVDGLVGSIPSRLGSLVNSQNILTTVANTSQVFVYFSLNEKDMIDFITNAEGSTQLEKIKQMPDVSLILANGKQYEHKGRIETIAGNINTQTGSASLRATFPNQEGLLRSGGSGKIVIPSFIDDALIIPQKATFSQQNKILTYCVQADSVVQTLIEVEPTPDGQSYVVTKGLKVGDVIVIEGLASLKNNMKIKVQ